MRKRPNLTEGQFDKQVDELKKWIRESVSPFEDDTPAKKRARIVRGKTDLLFFFETYLPHYFSCAFGECHPEWQEITELVDQFSLVGAPREHAKSTFFTLGNPVHKIVYRLKRFIWPCSDTHEQATGFSTAIKLELEENPRLRHDFGNLKTSEWSNDEFETSNGVKVLARGRGDKVRGLKYRQYRPDMAIFDDMENDETVENPRTTKKIINWIRGAVLGSLGAGYSAIMVGNLFHPLSGISQLIAEQDEDGLTRYVSKVYDAILDEGLPTERPLWPANWPMERLLKKRHQVGTYTFNKEYRNKVAVDGSPFPEEQAKFYERSVLAGKKLIIVTAVDPSAKAGEGNDFRAVVTWALDLEAMNFYCLHAWLKKKSIGEMFAAAYHQQEMYGSQTVFVEENMLKDFLHEAIANYAATVGRFLPWQPVQHNTNKEARIVGTCSYLWEFGRMLFEKNHSDQNVLREQFVYLLTPSVHDDGPDASEMAISGLQGGLAKPACAGGGDEQPRRPEGQEGVMGMGRLGRLGKLFRRREAA
jgi:predicted phage terminase large subunit-like protein